MAKAKKKLPVIRNSLHPDYERWREKYRAGLHDWDDLSKEQKITWFVENASVPEIVSQIRELEAEARDDAQTIDRLIALLQRSDSAKAAIALRIGRSLGTGANQDRARAREAELEKTLTLVFQSNRRAAGSIRSLTEHIFPMLARFECFKDGVAWTRGTLYQKLKILVPKHPLRRARSGKSLV